MLNAKLRKDPNAKKNPYIWLRFVSITEQTYTITLSEKNAKAHGIPADPWGDEMVPAPKRGGGNRAGHSQRACGIIIG